MFSSVQHYVYIVKNKIISFSRITSAMIKILGHLLLTEEKLLCWGPPCVMVNLVWLMATIDMVLNFRYIHRILATLHVTSPHASILSSCSSINPWWCVNVHVVFFTSIGFALLNLGFSNLTKESFLSPLFMVHTRSEIKNWAFSMKIVKS